VWFPTGCSARLRRVDPKSFGFTLGLRVWTRGVPYRPLRTEAPKPLASLRRPKAFNKINNKTEDRTINGKEVKETKPETKIN